MSKFYFDGSSSEEEEDIDGLPYPAPLARSAFLAPDFSPTAYLSTLRNRHQTLEDLRSDLRVRSQELSKELLDLVNSNYQDFIGLGASLKGGEDKVEELRLGLLGFKRDAEAIEKKVVDRSIAVRAAIDERKATREKIQICRDLLEIDGRVEELENNLMLISAKSDHDASSQQSVSSSEDSSDEEEATGEEIRTALPISLKRLRGHVEKYLIIDHLAETVGRTHPFVQSQDARISQLRSTILLDLDTALAHTHKSGKKGDKSFLRIIGLYREMGASSNAIKVIKESKQQHNVGL